MSLPMHHLDAPSLAQVLPPRPVVVHAKWRARCTTGAHHTPLESHIDMYDVLICPPRPLEVGMQVSLRALSLVAYHSQEDRVAAPRLYDTYDPQVAGPLVAIRAEEKDVVEFVLHNLCPETPVKYIYLSVQYVPGVTARMDMIGRARRWFLAGRLPCTRAVPIEWDAGVLTQRYDRHGRETVPAVWTRQTAAREDAARIAPPAPHPTPMNAPTNDTPPPSPAPSALATIGSDEDQECWDCDGDMDLDEDGDGSWNESREVAEEMRSAGWCE